MYCPKCYRQNDDSRTTCVKCGAKLRKPLFTKENAGKAFNAIKSEADKHGVTKENAGKAFNAIKSEADKRIAKKIEQNEKIKNLGESWKKTFKDFLHTAWSLTDKGIIYKNEVYDFSQIRDVVEGNESDHGKAGNVIQLFLVETSTPLILAYSEKEKADAREALVYIIEHLEDESVKHRYMVESENAMDEIRKHADDCRQGKITAETGLIVLGNLASIMVIKTPEMQEEIDEIRCELSELYEKELVAYNERIEAERLASEHRMRCNVCGHIFCYTDDDVKENTKNAAIGAITAIGGLTSTLGGGTIMHTHHLQGQADRYTDKIVDYSRCPVCHSMNISEMKEMGMEQQNNSVPAPTPAPESVPVVSPIEEIKQYKELLDLGIITQEEFNAKKKQLLGL